MKKIAAALLIVAGLACSAAAAEIQKVGIVDIGDIVRKSAAGKAAAASLEKKSTQYQESFKAKEKELERLKQSAQAKAATMTAAQRAAKEKEFNKKISDFQKYMQDARKEMMTRESTLTEKIVSDIETLARDYGKKNGFALVVKKDGLIMADEKYEQKDITADIMKAFDEKK